MRISTFILGFAIAPLTLVGLTIGAPPKAKKHAASASVDHFAKDIVPLIQKYCVACHTGDKPGGGVLLSGDRTTAQMLKNRSNWERAVANVSGGTMPPEGMPHPTPAEKEKILTEIQAEMARADCDLRNPGKVVMRRLNREEYNNTIHDLTGLDIRPADDFPSDDVGYGFDNIGDVLALSPLLMEKYLNAAEKVSTAAVVAPESVKPPRYDMAEYQGSTKTPTPAGAAAFIQNSLTIEHDFTRPGDYVVKLSAAGDQAGDELPKMQLSIDGQSVKTWEVSSKTNGPTVFEARIDVTQGKHKIDVAFLNDFYVAETKYRKQQDRNLYVYSVEVNAPKGFVPEATPSHKKIFGTRPVGMDDAGYAKAILSKFARRAYRRPATTPELARLMKCVDFAKKEGESFERGIQLGVQACLSSPNFLFHAEPTATPKAVKSTALGSYELASRLSYFLWSSMPDDELLNLAGKDKLQDPEVLAAQLKRMLKDPKAKALSVNFGGQWLMLRNLAGVAPSRRMFKDFTNELRTAMKTETEMFFDGIVHEDRPVLDFLDSDYTYLNQALAEHYGIQGVSGENFRKVALDGNKQRGGLMGMASILTVTSNPTRTSPVKRGKWVMEQILGTPLPPAPPNIPSLPDDKKEKLTGTLRQRMEQHRKNPSCASCHARMDPIGFGMENYDAVGGWRTADGTEALDSSGKLPSGQSFNGPSELKGILLQKKDEFAKCLTEKLLIYALGRGIEAGDRCNVTSMAKQVAEDKYKFSAIIRTIVLSEPFRKQRIDPVVAH